MILAAFNILCPDLQYMLGQESRTFSLSSGSMSMGIDRTPIWDSFPGISRFMFASNALYALPMITTVGGCP